MKKILALLVLASLPMKGTNVAINYNSTNGAIINPPPGVAAYNFPTGRLQVNGTNVTGGGLAPDAGGYLPIPQYHYPPTLVYQPTSTTGTVTTVKPFNLVLAGDSMVVGAAANIPFNVYYGAPSVTPNASCYAASLSFLGFCRAQGTVWPMAFGGETTSDGVAHFYNSPGQTCSVNFSSASTTGTLTTTPQHIISGAIVTGTGIPANTTMTNTQVIVAATFASQVASHTFTVSSATGIVTGMYATVVTQPNTSGAFLDGLTVTGVSGTTITMSGSTFAPSGSTGYTVLFFSPTVTFSNATTATGTAATLTSGGTLLTGTATFTSGSTAVTLSSAVTGLAPNSIWPFPMGSLDTPPGDYFVSGSGTSYVLGQKATASGTVTFYASAPLHDLRSNTSFLPNSIQSTPYLLSPTVTGVPGYLLDEYGINDSYYGVSLGTFETNYTALYTAAVGCGYTFAYQTIVPPANNNTIGENPTLVASYNAWLKAKPVAIGTNLIDVASQFPPNNVNIGDAFHGPDGVHPTQDGHNMMAAWINDGLLSLFASPTSVFYTTPLAGAGLNPAMIPSVVPQTTLNNLFGTGSTGSFQGVAQTNRFLGTVDVSSINGTPGNLVFQNDYYGTITPTWGFSQPTVSSGGTNLTISDLINGTTALVLNANFTTNGLTINGPASMTKLSVGTTSTTYTGQILSGSAGFQFDAPNQNVGGAFGSGGNMSFQGDNIASANKGGNFFFGGSTRGDAQKADVEIASNLVVGVRVDGNATSHNQGYVGINVSTGSIVPYPLTVNGNVGFTSAGQTYTIKGGSNAASGTVTLVAGTGTITSTAITSSDVVFTGLKTAGGTETFPPLCTVSTGTIVFTANPLDTGTYNWAVIHANQ